MTFYKRFSVFIRSFPIFLPFWFSPGQGLLAWPPGNFYRAAFLRADMAFADILCYTDYVYILMRHRAAGMCPGLEKKRLGFKEKGKQNT